MKCVERIGSGTFGVVYSAHSDEGKPLAVKRNLVEHHIDFSGCIRELDIMAKLKDHPYIVRLMELSVGNPFSRPLSPHGVSDMKDDSLHFVMEKGEGDLYHFLYESKEILVQSLFKPLMYQLLLALEYMHSRKIVHRDIKNNNILIFRDGRALVAKLCDFGLSKPYTTQVPLTPKISSSCYRPPEMIANEAIYDYRCDIWSMGCVFYEMIARTPFIVRINDEPNILLHGILNRIPKTITEMEFNRVVSRGQRTPGPHPFRYPGACNQERSWGSKFSFNGRERSVFNASEGTFTQYCDLLDKMLAFDYQERYTATQALDHPFFDGYRKEINKVRELYPPITPAPEILTVTDSKERRWALAVAEIIFKERAKFSWYNHRSFFLSLDIYDRYLNLREGIQGEQGHSQEEAEIQYLVCLYLAMKYFVTLFSQVSYRDIVPEVYRQQKFLLQAEQFELTLITEILDCKMYRDTLLEAADEFGDQLKEEDIEALFSLLQRPAILNGSTYKQVYGLHRSFRRMKKGKIIISHPK